MQGSLLVLPACTSIVPQDPGVVSVQRIYQALKQGMGSNTVVMGASFRTADEIRELAGCVLQYSCVW